MDKSKKEEENFTINYVLKHQIRKCDFSVERFVLKDFSTAIVIPRIIYWVERKSNLFIFEKPK